MAALTNTKKEEENEGYRERGSGVMVPTDAGTKLSGRGRNTLGVDGGLSQRLSTGLGGGGRVIDVKRGAGKGERRGNGVNLHATSTTGQTDASWSQKQVKRGALV